MVPRVEHQVIDGVEVKRCGICQEWRTLDGFRSDASRWDRLSNKCKRCQGAVHGKSRVTRSDARREYDRQYALDNRERKTAARTAWRARNKERDQATRQRSDERNRELIQARERDRIRDPKQRRADNQRWYEANRTYAIESVRRWRLENPDLAAVKAVRDRARRRARERELPSEPWTEAELIARDGLTCWINGCAVGLTSEGRRDWAVDHLIPIAVDFPDHPGDVLANLGIACHRCNTWKSARLLPAAIARYELNLEFGS